MSSTAGGQRGGGSIKSPFEERPDNSRGYTHPASNQKRSSMDSVIQYQPVPPTIQQAKSQEPRRLPTSVVAAYTVGPPIQRMHSHPALLEQGIQRRENTIIPGPPGQSFGPFNGPELHQNRPSEQTYREGPQLNFKYDGIAQDSNHSRGQQHPGHPYPIPHPPQARQEQLQQNQQTIPSAPQRPPLSAAPSPTVTHPPPSAPNRKPNTSTPIHPDAIKAAAKALTPIQHLYEEAWVRTVAGVQHEISRMHAELSKLIDVERRQNQMMRVERDAVFEEANRLRAENAEMREEVKRAADEVQRVRLDRDEQVVEFRRLQANHEVLQRQGQAHMLRAQAGEQAQKDAMHSTMESIRADLEKQFDAEMSVKSRELQEQKTLRALAEKRLAEATQKLKGITDNLRSASEFCSEQERQSSESATLIGTPEMELSKIKYEREDDTGRARSPIARGDRVFGSRPPSRATPSSPLVTTSAPHVKKEPDSTRQATPSTYSPHTSPRVESPQHSTSTLRSPRSLYLHIPDTPHDHHESHGGSSHVVAPHSTSINDDRPREKGSDERPPSTVAAGSDFNERQPQSITQTPSIPPPERQSQPDRTSRRYSPSLGPRPRPHPLQINQPLSPRQVYPPLADYHKLPPPVGPSNQHYRPTTRYTPVPSPRSAGPPGTRFTIPPPPLQGSPDFRKRKRSRTEFEPDGGARGAGEYRRPPPARSFTDPSDDRERSRPRPKFDEPRTSVRAETLPEIVPAPATGSSPIIQATPSSSASTSTGPPEEGELLIMPRVEGGGAQAVSEGSDVKQQPDKDKAAAARPRPPNKIGINHMDILYETRGDKMICRMCRSRPKDKEKPTPPVTFPTNATWPELVGHCKTGHPKDWGDLERLNPSQIGELRQRMSSSSSAGFMLR